MLSHFQAAVLGILQGMSELFPISSLGHSVILAGLLGWPIDQKADYFLTFVVATHFATALALFVVYWDDWVRITSGMLGSIWRSAITRRWSIVWRYSKSLVKTPAASTTMTGGKSM